MGTGGQNCPLILWFNLGFIEVLHSSTAKTMGTGLPKNAHYKEIHIILVTRQKMKQTLAKNKKCFTRKLIKPCALPKKRWRKNIERRRNQTLSGSNSTETVKGRFWCPFFCLERVYWDQCRTPTSSQGPDMDCLEHWIIFLGFNHQQLGYNMSVISTIPECV